MTKNLKNHVLSQYAEVITLEQKIGKINNYTVGIELAPQKYIKNNYYGGTVITETMESSDADEFQMGSTCLTHSIEDSDPDEFLLYGNSVETRAVEISDPDEFKMEPTTLVFTDGITDKDVFLLM